MRSRLAKKWRFGAPSFCPRGCQVYMYPYSKNLYPRGRPPTDMRSRRDGVANLCSLWVEIHASDTTREMRFS